MKIGDLLTFDEIPVGSRFRHFEYREPRIKTEDGCYFLNSKNTPYGRIHHELNMRHYILLELPTDLIE